MSLEWDPVTKSYSDKVFYVKVRNSNYSFDKNFILCPDIVFVIWIKPFLVIVVRVGERNDTSTRTDHENKSDATNLDLKSVVLSKTC